MGPRGKSICPVWLLMEPAKCIKYCKNKCRPEKYSLSIDNVIQPIEALKNQQSYKLTKQKTKHTNKKKKCSNDPYSPSSFHNKPLPIFELLQATLQQNDYTELLAFP